MTTAEEPENQVLGQKIDSVRLDPLESKERREDDGQNDHQEQGNERLKRRDRWTPAVEDGVQAFEDFAPTQRCDIQE